MDVKEKRRDLERLQEADSKLAARLQEITARTGDIREELAGLAVYGDPEDRGRVLRDERGELERERTELEGVRPVIEGRIQEARAALRRAAVEELAGKGRKVAGGLAGEHPRHVERAEEWEVKAAEARQKAQEAAERARALSDALATVAILTGVDTGTVRTVPGTRGRTGVGRNLDLGNVRRAAPQALRILEGEGLLTPEAKEAIEAAARSWTPEVEQRWREEGRRQVLDAQRFEAEKARDETDAWLRRLLQDGPVAKERIAEMAKRAGIALVRDPAQADLHSARGRLGVVPLLREGDPSGASWWWAPPTRTAATPAGFRRYAPAGPALADFR